MRLAGRAPTESEIREARQVLPAFQMALRPVQPDVLRSWVKQLAAGLVQPPGVAEDQWFARMGALCMAIGDLPAMCFTADTLKRAYQTMTFVPSGKELLELLDPVRADAAAQVAAIERIARSTPRAREDDKPFVPSSDEEWARSLSNWERAKEQMSGESASERGPSNVKPSYGTKQQIALAATPSVLAMRPDLRAALDAHHEGRGTRN
ncbi:MAG TPA: hypothetical protein VFG62_08685 [Rhodopila sp.]|nr:hypothetical protein [Rhodopila sp.]